MRVEAVGDDAQLCAVLGEVGFADWDREIFFGNLVFDQAVRAFVLEEHDRIRVLDRGV